MAGHHDSLASAVSIQQPIIECSPSQFPFDRRLNSALYLFLRAIEHLPAHYRVRARCPRNHRKTGPQIVRRWLGSNPSNTSAYGQKRTFSNSLKSSLLNKFGSRFDPVRYQIAILVGTGPRLLSEHYGSNLLMNKEIQLGKSTQTVKLS